jgi:flavodoxin I
MKVLVTYYTMTGNTEKLAKAIHQEVSKGHESYLKKVDEVKQESLNLHDLIFVGSPTHAGNLAAPVKKFLGELPQSPRFKVAAFITHSSPDKRDFEQCLKSFDAFSKDKGFVFLGGYDCQGCLAPEIQPYVKEARKASDAEWKEMMRIIAQRPTAEDMRQARKFAREVLARV